jgi:hypothetical protein
VYALEHDDPNELEGEVMAFEVFDKRMAPLAKSPAVTIQKRGIFSINKVAHEMIGSAETVELLYDKEARIIAIRPVEGSPPHAYTMRSQSKRETGQTILSATAFTQYYDIDTSVSRRWEPYKQGDMLCIDLNRKSTEIRGNRSKKEPDTSEVTDTDSGE